MIELGVGVGFDEDAASEQAGRLAISAHGWLLNGVQIDRGCSRVLVVDRGAGEVFFCRLAFMMDSGVFFFFLVGLCAFGSFQT